MARKLSTMDQLVGEVNTAVFYREDGTTTEITFPNWDELFKQAKACGAERIHISGGRFVKFRGDWYFFEDR